MSNKNKVKPSQNIELKEEIDKSTKFTFGFRHLQTDSRYSNEDTFNNRYVDIFQFLKTNSDLIAAMMLISNETYKTAIIGKVLLKTIHFKELEEKESIERITGILTNVYGKGDGVVKELSEGSTYLEFGMTKGCRYIGVLIDYHIIELLYFDPQHLSFPNYSFGVDKKMSYTFLPLYDLKSGSSISPQNANVTTEFDTKNILVEKLLESCQKQALDMMTMIIDELYKDDVDKDGMIKMMKEIKEEYL